MPQTLIFSIEVDPNLIPDNDLAPLLQALQDFEPVLEEWEETLQSGEKENFASQGGFFGDPWAALAPSTLRNKAQQGFPATSLVRTGRLQDAIGQAITLTPDTVSVGVDSAEVPYAAYHQTGTSRMPARVLFAITDDMADAMMNTLRSYLANATGGDMSGINIVIN